MNERCHAILKSVLQSQRAPRPAELSGAMPQRKLLDWWPLRPYPTVQSRLCAFIVQNTGQGGRISSAWRAGVGVDVGVVVSAGASDAMSFSSLNNERVF